MARFNRTKATTTQTTKKKCVWTYLAKNVQRQTIEASAEHRYCLFLLCSPITKGTHNGFVCGDVLTQYTMECEKKGEQSQRWDYPIVLIRRDPIEIV